MSTASHLGHPPLFPSPPDSSEINRGERCCVTVASTERGQLAPARLSDPPHFMPRSEWEMDTIQASPVGRMRMRENSEDECKFDR
jgi:hypothetical protein